MSAKTRKRPRKQPQAVTSGSTIRLETPTSSRQPKPNLATTVQDINPVGGFVTFLREHAIVGLAIGFIVGQQAQTLIKQLVASFIDPLSKLLFGTALSQYMFTLHFHGRTAHFTWGAFAYGLLNFLLVLAVIYFIVKSLKLDKLDKVAEEEDIVEERT